MKKMALLLVICMLAGILSGCGGTPAAEPTEPAAAETDSAQPGEPDASPAFYPVAEEPVKLTGWGAIPPSMISHVEDENIGNILNMAKAQEATNIHVEWRAVSLDDGTAQLGITLASGDIPDILTLVERFYAGGRGKLLADEICVDVLEIAPEWAPDWYAFYQETPAYANSVTSSDGKVVQMFGYKNYIDNGTVIRGDWLEKLEMDIPKTYDQLTQVLEAFVVEFDAKYAVGLNSTGAFGNHVTTWSTGGYGVIGSLIRDNQLPWLVDENGQVQMCYAQDGFYEYSSMLNDWFNKGIVSDDFLSFVSFNDDNMTTEGAGYGYANVSLLSDATRENTGIKYVPLAEPTKNEGDIIKVGGVIEGISNFGAAISADSDQVEYALKYLNWFWTDEGTLASNFGEEGITYHYDNNGQMYWDDLIVNNPDGLNLKLAQYVYCGYVSMGYKMDYDMVAMSFTNDDQRSAQEIWTSNRTSEYEYFGVLTAEEQAIYDSHLADMCTFISEKYVGYITGNEPLENFQQNVEQLYDMGLQEMIDVKQAAYDRYIAAQ